MQEDKATSGDDPLPHLAGVDHVEEADAQVSVSTGDLAKQKLHEMPYVQL